MDVDFFVKLVIYRAAALAPDAIEHPPALWAGHGFECGKEIFAQVWIVVGRPVQCRPSIRIDQAFACFRVLMQDSGLVKPMTLTLGVAIENCLVGFCTVNNLGQTGKYRAHRGPAYLRCLVEKDVEVFRAENFVNALLVVESVNPDQGAIGMPDFKVAFKQAKVAAAPEHFDKAIRPEAFGGGDSRPPRHENPRSGICGGLDTEPGQDYIRLAGPRTAIEKMAAEFRPFKVVFPCDILLGCECKHPPIAGMSTGGSSALN